MAKVHNVHLVHYVLTLSQIFLSFLAVFAALAPRRFPSLTSSPASWKAVTSESDLLLLCWDEDEKGDRLAILLREPKQRRRTPRVYAYQKCEGSVSCPMFQFSGTRCLPPASNPHISPANSSTQSCTQRSIVNLCVSKKEDLGVGPLQKSKVKDVLMAIWTAVLYLSRMTPSFSKWLLRLVAAEYHNISECTVHGISMPQCNYSKHLLSCVIMESSEFHS